jgi:hypothetical protein
MDCLISVLDRPGVVPWFTTSTAILTVNCIVLHRGSRTTGSIGKRIHLRNYGGVAFVYVSDAGTAGEDTDLDVQQPTAASGGTTSDLDVVTKLYKKREATLDADETWTSRRRRDVVGTGIASALHQAGLVTAISILIGVPGRAGLLRRPRLVPGLTVQPSHGNRRIQAVITTAALARRLVQASRDSRR